MAEQWEHATLIATMTPNTAAIDLVTADGVKPVDMEGGAVYRVMGVLDRLAGEGWEIVSTGSLPGARDTTTTYLLRRQKLEQSGGWAVSV